MLSTREYGPLTTGFAHFGDQIQHIHRNIAYIPPDDVYSRLETPISHIVVDL